jgi:amidase
MNASHPWQLSATEIAQLVSCRQLSAVEVAQAAIERLEAVNPAINAVVEYRPAEILSQARNVDARIARGESVGPLAGVPVLTKVNVDHAGYATTNGLRMQKDLVAKTSSPVVDNLLKTDAIAMGRTNTPAFSYRWFTGNLLHGTTFNPHNPALTPGGSSGGSAAAVAAGIAPLAHGTDIAGSIRYPAYACGLHGLRPSFGRVPAWNASASAERPIGGQIMAVSGPIARSIADLRLGLHAMAQADARDPWWVPAPLEGPPLPRKVAMCLRPDGLDTVPEVCNALLDAAGRLRDAGWTVEEVDALPPLKDALAIQITLWMGDGYDALVEAARREGDPGAIAALAGQEKIARAVGVKEFSSALANRLAVARAWQLFLERYPLVLLPICAELPFENNLDLQGPEAYERVWRAQLPMIALPVTGLPALCVHTGMVGRSPVGVQLVAPRFREDHCLAAGADIEARGTAPRIVTP